MIDLYLITGFLGAGKTTALKNVLYLLAPRRIQLIINEFGKVGVDGALLEKSNAMLKEITDGSVFCTCRLDQFMAALSQAVTDQPDAVVVEASGLSDPTGIYRLLSETEAFSRAFRYRGSICMVDAMRLIKVFHTVRVCPKQLAVSSLILLNKTDIATPEQREEVMALLREQCPGAHIIETQYGAITAEQLALLTPLPAEGDIAHRPDITLQKAAIRISPLMTLQELRYFITQFAEDTYRVKGMLQLQDGVFLIDCVGPVLQISPCDCAPDDNNTLTALAGPRMPLRKSLLEALKWYSGKAEWMQ